MLVYDLVVQTKCQVLSSDIDGGLDVRVHRFVRDAKGFDENVDAPIVSHEPNQVIATALRLGQGMPGRVGAVGKAQTHGTGRQRRIGRAPRQFAVAVVRIVPGFERQMSLNFSTTPLRHGSAGGMNHGSTPAVRHKRIKGPIPRGWARLP